MAHVLISEHCFPNYPVLRLLNGKTGFKMGEQMLSFSSDFHKKIHDLLNSQY
jgi:hypothetical protein